MRLPREEDRMVLGFMLALVLLIFMLYSSWIDDLGLVQKRVSEQKSEDDPIEQCKIESRAVCVFPLRWSLPRICYLYLLYGAYVQVGLRMTTPGTLYRVGVRVHMCTPYEILDVLLQF